MALDFCLDLLILETMGKQSRWQRKLKLEVIEVQKGQQSLLGSLGSRQGCRSHQMEKKHQDEGEGRPAGGRRTHKREGRFLGGDKSLRENWRTKMSSLAA